MSAAPEGILLIDKPVDKTSFSLVGALRRHTKVKKIGHAGTLDPFATGVMVLLIGKKYTRLSDSFLCSSKKYIATVKLGEATDTFDHTGEVTTHSDCVPSPESIDVALQKFQGEILQTPPMFSAKKIAGKKLYELARKGISVQRQAVPVTLQTTLLSYEYPHLTLEIACSKGTYIRSIADDLGKDLGCYGHLVSLRRTASGNFSIEECIDGNALFAPEFDWKPHIRTE